MSFAKPTIQSIARTVNGLLDWQNIRDGGLNIELFDSTLESYINELAEKVVDKTYNTGETSVKFETSKISVAVTVEHGLGVIPSHVNFMYAPGVATEIFFLS